MDEVGEVSDRVFECLLAVFLLEALGFSSVEAAGILRLAALFSVPKASNVTPSWPSVVSLSLSDSSQ